MYGQFLDHVNHVKGWMGWFCNFTLALLQKQNNSKYIIVADRWCLFLKFEYRQLSCENDEMSYLYFFSAFLKTPKKPVFMWNQRTKTENDLALDSMDASTSKSQASQIQMHLKIIKKFLDFLNQVLSRKCKIFLKSVRTNQHKCSAWGGKK